VYCNAWEESPMIYKYQRGDTLELLGEKEFNMLIALPKVYSGYLHRNYVREEIDVPIRGRIVRIKDVADLKDWNYTIKIKDSDSWTSADVVEFYDYNLPSKEFVVSSQLGDWYLITIPRTGWVPMEDLIFHMDRVAD
ncbi:MAG: hypothetical protein JSV97_05065, partial [candidate division WOR-3 bacterium]